MIKILDLNRFVLILFLFFVIFAISYAHELLANPFILSKENLPVIFLQQFYYKIILSTCYLLTLYAFWAPLLIYIYNYYYLSLGVDSRDIFFDILICFLWFFLTFFLLKALISLETLVCMLNVFVASFPDFNGEYDLWKKLHTEIAKDILTTPDKNLEVGSKVFAPSSDPSPEAAPKSISTNSAEEKPQNLTLASGYQPVALALQDPQRNSTVICYNYVDALRAAGGVAKDVLTSKPADSLSTRMINSALGMGIDAGVKAAEMHHTLQNKADIMCLTVPKMEPVAVPEQARALLKSYEKT